MLAVVLLYIISSVLLLMWGVKSFVVEAPKPSSDLSSFELAAFKLNDGAVVVSEGMLEIFLASSGIDALSSPQVAITNSEIEIVSTNEGREELSAKIKPKADGGKLVLEFTKVSFKGFDAPKFLTGALDQVIAGLAESINTKMKVKNVVLQANSMRVEGTPR